MVDLKAKLTVILDELADCAYNDGLNSETTGNHVEQAIDAILAIPEIADALRMKAIQPMPIREQEPAADSCPPAPTHP